MKKFGTFIFFILLVVIWSLVFGLYKYYFWGLFTKIDSNTNLQTISGYMAFGLFLAYLSGGIITKVFSKRALLIFVGLINVVCLIFLYLFSLNSILVFNIITVFFGFFYGIRAVLKTVLAGIEINKTGLSDTAVNATATIAYILMLIIGSIMGSLMSEKIGNNGIWVINILMIFASFVGYFMVYEDEIKVTNKISELKFQMNAFFSNMFLMIRSYSLILISSGILWSVSAIISQKAIEYSVSNFHKLPSEASMLLLYSAVGVIVGSIVSVFMTRKNKELAMLLEEESGVVELTIIAKFQKNKRWYYFNFFNLLFVVMIFLFPALIRTYSNAIILASVAGFLFGIISNLIDSFYINKITQDNNKEYGGAYNGVLVNLIVFLMMFGSN